MKGFKSKGKFFKIMGPKGEDRKAFQILEVGCHLQQTAFRFLLLAL